MGHDLKFMHLLLAQLLKRAPVKQYVHIDRVLCLPKGSGLPSYFCRCPLNDMAETSMLLISCSDLPHTC